MYDDIVLGFEFEVEGKDCDIYGLIDNSTSLTGLTEHYIECYHNTMYKTGEGLWRVEKDSTICGAEFISPPENYHTAKKTCKTFFEMIKNSPGIKTTSSCGLHVGMSVNGNLNSIDLTNIIPNINYRLLATLWPTRMFNKSTYCNNLKRMLKNTNIYTKKTTINDISNILMCGAYSFIKTKNYENVKYIEFRVPGGVDYHFKFDELFTSIDHISDILLGYTKLSKKDQQKKMYSYINRSYKSLNTTTTSSLLKQILSIPEILLEFEIPIGTFTNIYYITNTRLTLLNNNRKQIDELNEQNYLYYFFNYMVTHKMVSELRETSKHINKSILISVPENIQQSDMIKMLKVWEILPYSLTQTLLNKLNQRTYNYFIKYYINRSENEEQLKWISDICEKIDKV